MRVDEAFSLVIYKLICRVRRLCKTACSRRDLNFHGGIAIEERRNVQLLNPDLDLRRSF